MLHTEICQVLQKVPVSHAPLWHISCNVPKVTILAVPAVFFEDKSQESQWTELLQPKTVTFAGRGTSLSGIQYAQLYRAPTQCFCMHDDHSAGCEG